VSANEFEFCKAWWRAGTTLRANAENREFDPNVCPCVGFVKLHCRLISTQENFPQERTALPLELTTLVLCNFPSVTILRRDFLGANWPFYITKDLM
jgi:hypothetical protein